MNIKTLLNKKTWTGVEIGKALISCLMYEIKNAGKNVEPLLSQADFDRMLNSLETEPQIGAYLVYQNIYQGCIDNYNKCSALEQQAFNGYYRYLMSIENIEQADNILKATAHYPLLFTESQYERVSAQCMEYMRGYELTIYEAILELASYYAEHIEEAPEPIRKELEALEKEKLTDELIIEHYCEDMSIGHYELPDGSRSDKLELEEWQEALKRAWITEHNISQEDIDRVGLKEIVKAYNEARYLQNMEIIFKGEDAIKEAVKRECGVDFEEVGATIDEFTEQLLQEAENYKPNKYAEAILNKERYCKWVVDELPDDVTKLDILLEYDLMLYYSEYYDELTESIEAFKKEYSKLFTLLQDELKKVLGIKKLDLTKKITWGELADKGLKYWQGLLNIQDYDLLDYYCNECVSYEVGTKIRASHTGVAVIKNGILTTNIDKETGDYIEPVSPYAEAFSLDRITIEEAEQIEGYLKILVEPAIRKLLAHNEFIQILSETYDIPELTQAKRDMRELEGKIDALNNLLYITYTGISGSMEEKRRKRALIKDYYRPVEWESLKPTEDAIQTVRDMFSRLKLNRSTAEALTDFDKYLDMLMREGEEYGE